MLGTGHYPFATLEPTFDSINIGNLNTQFSIPIVNRQGRGLPFSYSLQYEGLVWTPTVSASGTSWTPDPSWGFTGVLNGTSFAGHLTYSQTQQACPRPPNYSGQVPPAQNTNKFVYHDPFGANHLFNYSIKGSCPLSGGDDTVSGDGSAQDNSGYAVVNGYQVSTRNGSLITPAFSPNGQDNTNIVDSNGNEITSSGGGIFTDTSGSNALTISGSSPRIFSYPVTLQPNGATSATTTISYRTYTVRTNFQCPNIAEYGSTSANLIDRVTFADGSFYAFAYEGTSGASDGAVTSRLASITLPTGGLINYTYSGGCSGAAINPDGTVGSLTRATSDGTRTYGRSGINANSTSTTVINNSVQRDASGNAFTYSYYGYDEVTPSSTSGLPNHVSATGTRGNLTSTHTSAGSVYLSTSATYNDTGMPTSTTDQGGFATSYGYDSTGTFVTTTNLPTPSSNVALSTSAAFDQQSAMPISVTGMNANQTTQITQYDSLLRPLAISMPIGSATYTYYPNGFGVYQAVSNGVNTNNQTLLDGYGRTSRVALNNGQSNSNAQWYQVDYCYDASGLLQFQSVPYAGAGFSPAKHCSNTGTSYTYDALGRVVSSVNADGTATSLYQSRAVKTTDVNGVQKITQYDLLGRVSGICEISSNTLAGQSPTNCAVNGQNMDIAGTGFVTVFGYDLVNHITTISQGAQSRTFQTDPAGRPTSTTEPERGVTGYSYTYNTTGLQVVRSRPRANQSNAGTITHTTSQYDSLGRLTNVTYDDNLTSQKGYFYDGNFNLGFSATSNNAKGMLAGAASGSAGPTQTADQFSYDLMGHVTTMWQCAPSICGTSTINSRPALQFAYDLAGNLTYEADGASGAISYGRSQLGEITSMTNQSYAGGYNPPNIMSNVANGPYGATNYSLGNGTSVVQQYDSMGRLSGGWLCTGNNALGSSAYCPGNTQVYGYTVALSGSRVIGICDALINQCQGHGYDEFNRLTAVSGANNNYTYTYDRYGNRLQQTSSPSGPNTNVSFNATNNQLTSGAYDAAGNWLNDGVHSYTYDAEGNVLQVDSSGITQYIYDALNNRVKAPTNYGVSEFLYDFTGRRTSTWIVANNFGNEGRIYADGRQIAFRDYNGQTFYEHQDWEGTERLRTNYQGQAATVDLSLAFGDGYSESVSIAYSDQDNLHFAGLDHDNESNTDHAQFRQYSPTQGRWMSPDPYDGSYNPTDPQSLNRYSYTLDNPFSAVDPTGKNCTSSITVTVTPSGTTYDQGDSSCSPNWGPSPGPWYLTEYGGPYGQPGGQCALSNGGVVTCPLPASGSSGPAPSSGVASRLACAAKYGQAHSIGAAFGGGKVASFLGGNSVSSLLNLGLAATGNGPSPNPINTYLSGPAFGVPINDALRLAGRQTIQGIGSASGTVRGAAIQGVVNSFLGTDSALVSLSGEASIAAFGGVATTAATPAEAASVVGLAKFGFDTLTVAYGYAFGCPK